MLSVIKSKYVLKNIFEKVNKLKYLEIIRHNKNLQNLLDLTIKDYESAFKECGKTEIEIIPCEPYENIIINPFDNQFYKENKSYIHLDISENLIKMKLDVDIKS